jgi:Molybdopterin converting factor, large subunit
MTELQPTAIPSEPRVVLAGLTTLPIDAQMLLREMVSSTDGAVVTFDGIVRDHDHGRTVTMLRYSAHPTAADVIRRLAQDIAREHPGVALSVAHRIGDLAIGDCALACAVSSAHRAEAFLVCAALVDRVKERVPIWRNRSSPTARRSG